MKTSRLLSCLKKRSPHSPLRLNQPKVQSREEFLAVFETLEDRVVLSASAVDTSSLNKFGPVTLPDDPVLMLTDNSGAYNDARVQFNTALSQYRAGATDSDWVRPGFADSLHYIEITNAGAAPLTLFQIDINAPDVTTDVSLTAAAGDDIVLATGQTLRIHLTFDPLAAGAPSLAGASSLQGGGPAVGDYYHQNGIVIHSNASNTPVAEVQLHAKVTNAADLNYDGFVNFGDLGMLNSVFGLDQNDPEWDPTADINGDGIFNFGDLGVLNTDFGELVESHQFVVNTFEDTVDVNVGDGIAADANGNTSLRAAIMEANAFAGTDTIIVDAGTYQFSLAGSNEDAAATGDLDITDDLMIVGVNSNVTIIDAAGLDRVFEVHGGANVSLYDITITGGSADIGGGILNGADANLTMGDAVIHSNQATDSGGGIASHGSFTIFGSTILNNSAEYGGGLYSIGDENSAPDQVSLISTRVENNTATAVGGGLLNEYNNVTVDFSTFIGNSAVEGGGIGNFHGGEMTVNNSLITANTAGVAGGGLANELTTLNLLNSRVIDNHSDDDGGGVFNWAGTLNVDNTEFIENSATRDGGGIENTGNTIYDPGAYPAGIAHVSNSSFTNNTAGELGGGINNRRDGQLTVEESQFTSNTALHGGGVSSVADVSFPLGHAAISGSTFSNNTATDHGGGFFNSLSTAQVTGSTFIGNTAYEGGGIANMGGGETTVTSSLIQNNSSTNEGGGLTNELSVLNVVDSQIIGNHSDDGGGLFNWAGTITVTGSDFSSNSAGRGGGGIENTGRKIEDPTAYGPGMATISDSTFTSNTAGEAGGGVRNYRDSEMQISGSTFTFNSAQYGGGIANSGTDQFNGGQLTVTGSTISNNTASEYGGGLFSRLNITDIDDSTFEQNSAWEGGGIASLHYGEVTVTDSLIKDNTVGNEGGGLTNELAILNVIDSQVIGNHTGNDGGGVFNWAGTLNVSGSLFSGNSADRGGGGIENTGRTAADPGAYPAGIAHITTSSILSNSSGEAGGGVRNNRDSVMDITYSTIAFNTSVNGGGVANTGTTQLNGSTLSISNSTISTNTATGAGGGLYNLRNRTELTNVTIAFNNAVLGGGISNDVSGTVQIVNSIVTGGQATTDDDVRGVFQSLGHNLIGDVGFSSGFGAAGDILNIDPATVLAAALADNGGPTLTHALLSGSAAINAGSNSNVDSDVDQRGFDRIGGGTVDIGALEFGSTAAIFGDLNLLEDLLSV